MNKSFFAFLVLIFCSFQSMHAQRGKISGRISAAVQPLPAVVVSLQAAKDATLVKTAISQADGSFEFDKLKDGAYRITVDDAAFAPYQSATIEISPQKSEILVPVIVLEGLKTNNLNEVVVKNKKPLIENKIDKTVVNVDAMMGVSGADALDVLAKSPGISVDENGTITFRGKTGVSVFIDDKPTYLSGAELEAYLKSLPASTLNQIELMTNPPAKYDAAGSAGVINILTRKSKTKGFNGSLSARVSRGKYTFNREGLNLNYLNNKVRIFGNIGYSYQEPTNDLYIYRRFKNEDLSVKSNFDQRSLLHTRLQTSNVKAGADYYATESTTFGFSVSGVLRTRKSNSDVSSVFSDAGYVADSSIIANNRERNSFGNGSVNLNFRHDLDTKGQKITADLDYLNYNNETDQTFENFTYRPDHTLRSRDASRGSLPSDIAIYSIKADYALPMKNENTLEAGYKMSISKTDNTAVYNDVTAAGDVPNYDMSNHFKYDETIYAAYVNFNKSYKRFTFQTGLRVENTASKGRQLGNLMRPATEFSKNYTNLFPTAYVQYRLDSIGSHQLVASYGKRINRPYYEDLNPFVSPLDKFTFYAGNPYLSPTFSYNYELSYRYKGYFSTALSYGRTKDEINETIEIDEHSIYYSRPGNIGKSELYSLNVNAEIPFAKWLTTSVYSEVTHTAYKSRLYTETLDAEGTFWYIQGTNNFKLGKDWSAELSATYQTDVVSAQFRLGARGNVNAAVQKKFLQGRASAKLIANDIFYGNINTGTINNLHLTDASWVNKPDARFIALALSYSFGKSFQSKEYEASGADSEKNRVKN